MANKVDKLKKELKTVSGTTWAMKRFRIIIAGLLLDEVLQPWNKKSKTVSPVFLWKRETYPLVLFAKKKYTPRP